MNHLMTQKSRQHYFKEHTITDTRIIFSKKQQYLKIYLTNRIFQMSLEFNT